MFSIRSNPISNPRKANSLATLRRIKKSKRKRTLVLNHKLRGKPTMQWKIPMIISICYTKARLMKAPTYKSKAQSSSLIISSKIRHQSPSLLPLITKFLDKRTLSLTTMRARNQDLRQQGQDKRTRCSRRTRAFRKEARTIVIRTQLIKMAKRAIRS
jgi:hypothetical protein